MDREIAPEVRRRAVVRRVAVVGVAVLAIVVSFVAVLQWLRPSVRKGDIQLARVELGSVDATLQASGTIVPAGEQVVSSPVEARVLRIVRKAGDRVHAGDEMVALDTSATRLDVARLAGRLTQKESEEAQLRLRVDETIAGLRAQIEQKKLDGEILRLKAQQSATLHKEGLVSAQDDLVAATSLRKFDIELRQLYDALARAQRTGAAQLGAAAADVATMRREREQSQQQLELAMMRADRDGVITSLVDEEGALVRRGDVVARIADLSAYRVDATISDVHAARLAAGMPVRVRIDESSTIGGVITSVEPRVEGGVVRFHVRLDDASNPKLRNNVRVDVFVITDRRPAVLRVRRGALGQGTREEVYVRRGDELVRVPVSWGLAGEDYIQPLNGVRPGDEVVISNMNDYSGVRRLRLKG